MHKYLYNYMNSAIDVRMYIYIVWMHGLECFTLASARALCYELLVSEIMHQNVLVLFNKAYVHVAGLTACRGVTNS